MCIIALVHWSKVVPTFLELETALSGRPFHTIKELNQVLA